jgi:hypothetical protein
MAQPRRPGGEVARAARPRRRRARGTRSAPPRPWRAPPRPAGPPPPTPPRPWAPQPLPALLRPSHRNQNCKCRGGPRVRKKQSRSTQQQVTAAAAARRGPCSARRCRGWPAARTAACTAAGPSCGQRWRRNSPKSRRTPGGAARGGSRGAGAAAAGPARAARGRGAPGGGGRGQALRTGAPQAAAYIPWCRSSPQGRTCFFFGG